MEHSRKACIFTGHRVIAAVDAETLPHTLARAVEWAYTQGYTDFWCGGAMGFDRMAADAVLVARASHPTIRLCMCIPCRDQADRWSAAERRHYRGQLEAADEVEVLSEHYYDGCMRARNLALAERADVCLAYVNTPRSGAAQTIGMVKKRGVKVYNLASEIQTG